MFNLTSSSPEQTTALAALLGKVLPSNSIISLKGELAAGKTTFTKGLIAGVTGVKNIEVTSPTFVYMNIYKGHKTIHHFDLYRLRDSDEFISMGFDDTFYANNIVCIEWADRIEDLLPQEIITITLTHISENERNIHIYPYDKAWGLIK